MIPAISLNSQKLYSKSSPALGVTNQLPLSNSQKRAFALNKTGSNDVIEYTPTTPALGLFCGNSNHKNKIVLTFDGEISAATDKILDILKEKKIKAVFFVIGSSLAIQTVEKVSKDPDPEKFKDLREKYPNKYRYDESAQTIMVVGKMGYLEKELLKACFDKNTDKAAIEWLFELSAKGGEGLNPEAARILKRIVAEGHVIGNHSFMHDGFAKDYHNYGKAEDIDKIIADLQCTQKSVDQALGYHYELKYIRPPYGNRGRVSESRPGDFDLAVNRLAGYMIMWNNSGLDCYLGKPSPQPDLWGNKKIVTTRSVINDVEHGMRSWRGGVVLLHALPGTCKLLPNLIDKMKKTENYDGKYTFSTLDDLIRIKYPCESSKLNPEIIPY
jgi:peptidoglycan/xylan/chitin deacetylase (PgdA/CDA1 family)